MKLSREDKSVLNAYWLWVAGNINDRKFFSFLRDFKKMFTAVLDG